jgi:lipid-binding SYLF domain-containing protein
MRFKRYFVFVAALALAGSVGVANAAQNSNNQSNKQASKKANANSGASETISPAEQTRVAYSAAGILRGQMTLKPKHRIPKAVLNHAHCIAVFPGVFKEGVIFAGSHGDGIVSCRNNSGNWSPPVYFNLSAGSVGFQAGAKVTQLLVLFMTNDTVQQLMNGNFKFGGTAGVAAGPFGLHANVHSLPAATVAYKLDQTGLFGGAEIKGTTISADQSATRKIYGQNASIKHILRQGTRTPERLQVLTHVLSMYAPPAQFAKNKLPVKSQTAK